MNMLKDYIENMKELWLDYKDRRTLLNPFFLHIGFIIFFIVYFLRDFLMSRGWSFNEEILLIINFFFLMHFFFKNVSSIIGHFLNNRRLAIRAEAERLLTAYRETALRLKNAYTTKNDLEDLLYTSFISIYKPYLHLKRDVEPYLLSSVLNRWALLQLSLIYKEEVSAIRANYVRKLNLLKAALPQLVEKELSDTLSEDDINISDR